jgi:hypothetical protein
MGFGSARAAADMSGQPLEPIFQAAARAAGMRVEASAEQRTAAIGEDVAVDPVAPAPENDDAPAQKPTVASFSDVLAQVQGRISMSKVQCFLVGWAVVLLVVVTWFCAGIIQG